MLGRAWRSPHSLAARNPGIPCRREARSSQANVWAIGKRTHGHYRWHRHAWRHGAPSGPPALRPSPPLRRRPATTAASGRPSLAGQRVAPRSSHVARSHGHQRWPRHGCMVYHRVLPLARKRRRVHRVLAGQPRRQRSARLQGSRGNNAAHACLCNRACPRTTSFVAMPPRSADD